MQKALSFILIIAKNSSESKKKIFFQMINHTVFLLFSVFLYKYVYELLPQLHDRLPYPNAIWSMSVYFIAFWLGLRNLERAFRNDIQSGNIEMYLLRPFSYIRQKIYMQIGEGLVPFISALVLSVAVSWLFVGLPDVGMPAGQWIVFVALIFVLSRILECIMFVLCGLTGFWLQDSQPVFMVVSKLMMIFGGAWVPVAFFPEVLQKIAEYSPFGATLAISYAMYPNFGTHVYVIILNVLFWIVAMGALMYVVSKHAMRKLSVNG